MDNTETKTGTIEDFQKDLDSCGFYPEPELPLDAQMAATRIRLDEAIQQILAESGLPLFLFDYLIASVQNDIRKADADMIRAACTHPPNTEEPSARKEGD